MKLGNRIASLLVSIVFSLIAYFILVGMLWIRDIDFTYQQIFAGGGLFFFATAFTSPIFFDYLMSKRIPPGIKSLPFFMIPVLILVLTVIAYSNILFDNVVANEALLKSIQVTNSQKVTDSGIYCAVGAIAYRFGFHP